MKREINPTLSYKRNTLQFLSELSKAVGIAKAFTDMTQEDILYYLDKCRKPEDKDPLHKWTFRSRYMKKFSKNAATIHS
jgi:uncharacterized protein YihD (DUF1040 family)